MPNQQAIKQSQALHSFLSIITHEIRTPMNGILHTTDFLCEAIHASKDKTVDSLEAAEILQQSSKRLYAFINDLGDFILLGCDEKRYVENFTADELLQKIYTLFTAINIGKPIKLRPRTLGGQLQIFAEKKRIYQTLVLMLLNIAKSISKGTISLQITTHTTTSSEETIIIENSRPANKPIGEPMPCNDNMPEQHLTISASVDSLGIDCNKENYHSLIKKNTEILQGQLQYGEVGTKQGSKFVITVIIPINQHNPIKKHALRAYLSNPLYYRKSNYNDNNFNHGRSLVENSARKSHNKNIPSPTKNNKKPFMQKHEINYNHSSNAKNNNTAISRAKKKANKIPAAPKIKKADKVPQKASMPSYKKKSITKKSILIIDDEEIGLQMVKMLLKKEGISIYTAKDGASAIKTLNQHLNSIKLVLMDIMLPDITGYELFQKFRQINRTLRIVAFSAENSSAEISKMIQHGFYNHLPKPFKKEELLQIVRSV